MKKKTKWFGNADTAIMACQRQTSTSIQHKNQPVNGDTDKLAYKYS